MHKEINEKKEMKLLMSFFKTETFQIEKLINRVESEVEKSLQITIPYILYKMLIKLEHENIQLRKNIAYALLTVEYKDYFYRTYLNLFYLGYAYEILYYEASSSISDDSIDCASLLKILYEKSISYYNQSIGINKNNLKISNYSKANIQKNLMELHNNKKSFGEVIKKLDDLIEKAEINNFEREVELLYNQRANINRELGKYDEALSDYKKSIQINPNQSSIYNNMGEICDVLGDQTLALRNYEKSIKSETTMYNTKYYIKRFNYINSIRLNTYKYSNENYIDMLKTNKLENIFKEVDLKYASADTIEIIIKLYLLFKERVNYFFQEITFEENNLSNEEAMKKINDIFTIYSKRELYKVKSDSLLIELANNTNSSFFKIKLADKYNHILNNLKKLSLEEIDDIYKFYWGKKPIYVKEYYYASQYFINLLRYLLEDKSNNKYNIITSEHSLLDIGDILIRIIKRFLETIYKFNLRYKEAELLEVELLEIEYYLSMNYIGKNKKSNLIPNEILRKLNNLSINYPNIDKPYKEKGDIYTILGNYESAKDNYLLAENIYGGDYRLFNCRGNLYYILNNHEMAIQDYKKTIAREKGYLWPYLSLINIYQDLLKKEMFGKVLENLYKMLRNKSFLNDSTKYIYRIIIENPEGISLEQYKYNGKSLIEEVLLLLDKKSKKYSKNTPLLEKLYMSIKDNDDFYCLFQKLRMTLYFRYKLKKDKVSGDPFKRDNYNDIIKEIDNKYSFRIFKTENLTKIALYREFIEYKLSFPRAITDIDGEKGSSSLLDFLCNLNSSTKVDQDKKEFLLKLEKMTLNITDYLELGVIHYMLGNYAIAIEKINRYLERNKRDNKALTYRALCYIALKKYVFSISDLKKSIEINDKYYKTYVGLILWNINSINSHSSKRKIYDLIDYLNEYLNCCPKIKTDSIFYQVKEIFDDYQLKNSNKEVYNKILKDKRIISIFVRNHADNESGPFYNRPEFIQWISRF